MKKLLLVGVVGLSALLGGCSSIQTYETMTQQQGTLLSTNVGGQVFKINRSSDMPNAFGKADLFGRDINRGYTELRYGGKYDGKLVFQVVEIETQSNETTMNQRAMMQTFTNGTTTANAHGNMDRYGNVNMIGTAHTNRTSTTYLAPKGETRYLPQNTAVFAVDEQRAKSLNISGVVVSVVSSDEVSITYTLTK